MKVWYDLELLKGNIIGNKHDNDDEFFFVVSGQLFIDLEDRIVELKANQGITISKEVLHRTRAPEKTVMLMVETNTIQPTGD